MQRATCWRFPTACSPNRVRMTRSSSSPIRGAARRPITRRMSSLPAFRRRPFPFPRPASRLFRRRFPPPSQSPLTNPSCRVSCRLPISIARIRLWETLQVSRDRSAPNPSGSFPRSPEQHPLQRPRRLSRVLLPGPILTVRAPSAMAAHTAPRDFRSCSRSFC